MSDKELTDFENLLKQTHPVSLSEDQLNMSGLASFAGGLSAIGLKQPSSRILDQFDNAVLEAECAACAPARLSEELLETLSLAPTEASLTEVTPKMSPSTLSTLIEKVESAETEITEEKVIPFPESTAKKKNPWRWYAAAAAVAIMGIFSGLVSFNTGSGNPPAFVQNTHTILPATFPQGSLLNVSTNSKTLQTQDQGLIPSKSNSNTFYRAKKVVTMETFVVENKEGEKMTIQRPITRFILEPAQAD